MQEAEIKQSKDNTFFVVLNPNSELSHFIVSEGKWQKSWKTYNGAVKWVEKNGYKLVNKKEIQND